MNKEEENLKRIGGALVIDKVKAQKVLDTFSQTIVTQRGKVRLLDNIISFFTMDTKGLSIALKLSAVLAVVMVIMMIAQLLGWNQRPAPNTVSKSDATPTVTVVVTESPTLETIEDVDYLASNIEKTVSEIDQLQQDLDSLEESLSTSEIDTLTKELDTIN